MALKANRARWHSLLEEKNRREYKQVGSVELEAGTVWELYLEQVEFPLLFVKQVFNNEEDGGEDVLYLFSSDLTLGYERLSTFSQKTWKVKEYISC